MANYIGLARSNYFAVRDEKKWEAFCERFELEPITSHHTGTGKVLRGFICQGNGIPTDIYDEARDTWIEIDFAAELSEQIEPGWVAIIQEIGYEKMRYLIGFAIAINHQNEQTQINLGNIYEDADWLGEFVTTAEY